ncbi:MAG: hypothetical protein HY717_08170 [Planctomycetes bacterium]|nr:hypothetical protein [Planctomycetota bacterium]
MKSFTHWLYRNRRIAENPLSHLDGLNPELDIRHRRRALSEEELAALIEAARTGPVVEGLSGEDRAML